MDANPTDIDSPKDRAEAERAEKLEAVTRLIAEIAEPPPERRCEAADA